MVLKNNIISLVHFMAYPGPGSTKSVHRGEAREQYLLSTIKKVIDDPYFGGIEITRIKDRSIRAKVADLLKQSNLVVTYSAQPVQLINEDQIIAWTDISSVNEVERRQAVDRIRECVDEAYELGATNFGMVSGRDPGTESGLAMRRRAADSLVRSIDEICSYARSRASELGRPPLRVMLESFDRLKEPGCKNQFVGPSEEAVEIVRTVRDVYGHKDFGLIYDLSHMLLLKGISLEPESPEVLKLLAPYLTHVHIGTCVTDRTDPLYGDTHPSFDYPKSAVTPELLAQFVTALHEIGYEGGIGFEVAPHDDEISESIINSTKAHFDMARNRIDVNYALGTYYFQTRRFFTEQLFDLITDTRVKRQGIVEEAAKARKRREVLSDDGKLVILAADHPARYVTSAGDNPVAMGDRLEYLGRILRVMASPEIDGIMATPDIVEDLLIIDLLLKERSGDSILDGKIMLGSMNRSGLAGVEYEMEDRMTAFTAQRMKELGMDGAKMMFRIDPDKHSRYSIYTISYCANAINECNRLGLPVFLEALPVVKTNDGYKVVMEREPLIKAIGVASALGESSSRLWLKIPYVERYNEVVRATTLPVLMLGGASKGNPTSTIEDFERGMGEGSNVRGAMVGRNVLFPGKDDPRAVASAIFRVVHNSYSAADAVEYLRSLRGTEIDWLTSRLG